MVDDNIKGFVNEDDKDDWGGYCVTPNCGGSGPGFSTLHWPSQDVAEARLKEHLEEHRSGKPMSLLSEFRKEHGLVVNERGWAVPQGATQVTLGGDE